MERTGSLPNARAGSRGAKQECPSVKRIPNCLGNRGFAWRVWEKNVLFLSRSFPCHSQPYLIISPAGFCLLLSTLERLEELFFCLFSQREECAGGANSKVQPPPRESQDGDAEEEFEGWEQGAFYPAGATDRAEGKWQVIMAAGFQPGCLEIPACKTFTKTRQQTRCFEDNRSGL